MRYLLWLPLVAALLFADAAWAANRALTGRVVDANGEPVSGVDVALAWTLTSGSSSEPIEPARTDADGRFEIVPPGRGLDSTLLAYDKARERGAVATVKAERRGHPVTLVLGPLAEVRGRTIIAGETKYPFGLQAWMAHADDPTQVIRLDFDKSTFAARVPPGRWTLTLQSVKSMSWARKLELEAGGEPLDLGEIAMMKRLQGPVPGELGPRLDFAEVGEGAAKVLRGAHFPPYWTLLYYWDYT